MDQSSTKCQRSSAAQHRSTDRTHNSSDAAAGQEPSILKSGKQDTSSHRALSETILFENVCYDELVNRRKDGSLYSVEMTISPVKDARRQIARFIPIKREVTERKQAEEEVEALYKRPQMTSRRAGTSEVATGVLHNVGNVLNSVNVTAAVVTEKLRRSRISNVAKAAELLSKHADDLETFISKDEKGRQLPGYLSMLADHLANEQAETLGELSTLTQNVEHINAIISMQQSYAGVSGLVEPVNAVDMLNDVLKMNAVPSKRHGIDLVREYDELPPVVVEKHKLLQILVNLVRNARDALVEGVVQKKRLTLRTRMCRESRLRIEVVDNGLGIPVENLTRIFAHGYTTKKEGHGFGLHGAALMAKEMGGSLTAHSDGPETGATFTLELPLQPAEEVACVRH